MPSVPALRPDPPSTPVARRRLWLWGGAGLMVLALCVLAYSQFWLARPTPVAIEIAGPGPVTRVLAVNGRLEAVRSVDVRSVVSGSLSSLLVAEGDHVEADQILAHVDAAAQNAVVRQAMAALDAGLEAQQQAVETYDRALTLQNTVARTVLEANAHSVQSAAQEVARLSSSILTLAAEEGQVVGPTIPLLTLADLGDLIVEADVDEAYATQIAVDQPVVLQLVGETDTRQGHVSFVSTRVDTATGGLTVKMTFDTPVVAPIGLTVTANILVDRREAALSIPRTAMQADTQGAAIFLAADGVARTRAVKVVDWPAARLIVTDGLVAGEAVIIDATGISDGQSVAAQTP